MNLQSRILTEPQDVGNFLVIYGPPGVGKTTFSTESPSVLFLQAKDESLDTLAKSGVLKRIPHNIKLESWEDSLAMLDSLIEQEHSYRVIVIDGASGLEEYCNDYVIANDCDGETDKFIAFGRGNAFASREWCHLLNKIQRLKSEKKVTVILLAHLDTVIIKNPTGLDYIKWRPAIGKEKFAPTNKYADAILLMDYETAVQGPKTSAPVAGKAIGGSARILRCEGAAGYEAKNRLNLPPLLYLGGSHTEAWQAFVSALKEARTAAA